MANSSIISELKKHVITEIINDETIFYAINSPDIINFEDSEKLINTHLFRYNQNPLTLKKTITFLTFQVHTSKQNKSNSNDSWIRPSLEIWIISHESCMKIDNIPKITTDRIDYISQLLDDKFNGRTEFGNSDNKLRLLGQLDLIDNSEGAFTKDYLYRRMLFMTKDINNSRCGN